MAVRLDNPLALLLLLALLPLLVWVGWPRLRYLPSVRRWTALGVRLAGVSLLAPRMHAAIDFDDQLGRGGDEVADVAPA